MKPEHLESARGQIRVVGGKGKKDRYTLLSPKLLEELRSYWRSHDLKEWLFPSPRDRSKPLLDTTAQRMFYAAVKRAGLSEKGGIHSLRHSFATHLLEAGVEITAVQKFLGHSDLSTTSVHLHVRQERLRNIGGPLDLLNLDRSI